MVGFKSPNHPPTTKRRPQCILAPEPYVLQHYVTVGFEELDKEKLTPLLRLKYHDSLTDAIADLGCQPAEINMAFVGFQKKYLYQQTATA